MLDVIRRRHQELYSDRETYQDFRRIADGLPRLKADLLKVLDGQAGAVAQVALNNVLGRGSPAYAPDSADREAAKPAQRHGSPADAPVSPIPARPVIVLSDNEVDLVRDKVHVRQAEGEDMAGPVPAQAVGVRLGRHRRRGEKRLQTGFKGARRWPPGHFE